MVKVVDASFNTSSGDTGKGLGKAVKSAYAHIVAKLTVCANT